jgi:hypothetical protein
MSRDDPERYDEYRALEISEELEMEWRRAAFDAALNELADASTLRRNLWSIHSALAALALDLKEAKAVQRLCAATEKLLPRVPRGLPRILVAETIVGRARDGSDSLIGLARDLGEVELARKLADLVPRYCASEAPPKGPDVVERAADVLARLKAL